MHRIAVCKYLSAAAMAVLFLVSQGGAAEAARVSVDFENIAPVRNSNDVAIGGFYDGGSSSLGTTGVNHGISFSSNALVACLNTTGITCSNASRGGQGDVASQHAGLYFMSGDRAFMNVSGGFETSFAFNYAATYATGSILIYSGLDGTGKLLASLTLGLTTQACASGYAAAFCPFQAAGLFFNGTARSVAFAGVANQVVFDDVTMGVNTYTICACVQLALPAPIPTVDVPEPATLALFGTALVGLSLTRRRR